jgi:DNA-binding NarL/FixJ family response regulator
VIALSAYDDAGLRLAVEASGMDGYLLKGTSPGLIREALQRSRPGTRRSASRVR